MKIDKLKTEDCSIAFYIHNASKSHKPIKRLQFNPSTTLIIYPFNLFGNFSNSNLFFDCNSDILISQFSTTDEALKARVEYYEKATNEKIEIEKNIMGIRLKSYNFSSISYYDNNLIDEMKKMKYRLNNLYKNLLAEIFYFQKEDI